MYDVFKNLKQSADQVALREGLTEGRTTNRGYLKRVADHYCGGVDTANNLTRQLAGIAVVLSWPVIEEMGQLLNKEDPDQAREIAKNTTEAYGPLVDARLCKNLLTKSTFRGATTFKRVALEADQINTLKRLSFLAPKREYKAVSKSELETQTKKTIAARREVEKMQDKLGDHSWPADMISVRDTLLTTNTLDAEVEENKGRNELLPTFQDLWERLFPIAVELDNLNNEKEIDAQDSEDSSAANRTSDNPRDEGEESVGGQDACEGSGDDEHSSSVVDQGTDEEQNVEEGDEGHTSQFCPLQQFSVRAENKGWRQFQMTLVSEDLFDFIFADPVQSLSAHELKQKQWTEFKDEKKIKEFANFCRVSLRPGCYVFAIVLPEEFAAFSSAFQAEGMKVMKAPFFIIPKPESVRFTRLKDLPQDCGGLAVVGKSPGTCPSFEPDFNRPYSLLDCTFKQKLGIIDNVPRCQNPLRAANSRAEVRPRERHPGFASEVIETFCAPTGIVLDTFGGALTTPISCISSGRPCVVLEQNKYCFDLGVRRLEKLCRDRLLNPDEAPQVTAGESFEEYHTYEQV